MAAKKSAHIEGTAEVRAVGERLLALLPEEASAQLPSRGQVAMEGTIGGRATQTVLEPDGRKGHWISLTAQQAQELELAEGSELEFDLTTAEEWPEPEVPDDLGAALAAAEDLEETWQGITPMARWEWVRWVGATKSEATRAKRVDVSIDKLRKGSRRPCCSDLASCTDPEVAVSGKLREG